MKSSGFREIMGGAQNGDKYVNDSDRNGYEKRVIHIADKTLKRMVEMMDESF
jgi:hypothetical protein